MAYMPKLCSIYCENPQKPNALEIYYLLWMTKDDFAFYENQKERRTATCINVVEPLTTSDVECKRKRCIAVTQTLQDCPSTPDTAPDESYLATSYTHISGSDTTSCNSPSSACREDISFHNTSWPTQNRFSY